MEIYKNITELIGNTPLLELSGIAKQTDSKAKILAKLEYFNPAGSVKDRVGLAMLNEAEKSGVLKKDTVIIEPTSGNTVIGIAAVASARGYRTVIVMPDSMSVERQKLLKAYGAELVLTDGKLGMTGAIKKAEELKKEYGNAFIPGQFTNPANPKSHELTTGPEIWNDTDGKVDIFIAGAGTGGTVSGVGRFLKSKNPDIKIIAVEPASSAVLSGGVAGAHKIQGIGAGFVPDTLDMSVIDEIIKVGDDEALSMIKTLVKADGVLCGVSSAAAVCGAIKVAKRETSTGKTIVTLLPDGGEKYLSLPIFE